MEPSKSIILLKKDKLPPFQYFKVDNGCCFHLKLNGISKYNIILCAVSVISRIDVVYENFKSQLLLSRCIYKVYRRPNPIKIMKIPVLWMFSQQLQQRVELQLQVVIYKVQRCPNNNHHEHTCRCFLSSCNNCQSCSCRW